MGSVFLKLTNNAQDGVDALELAIRNAGDWSAFWGNRNSPLSQLWARSRVEMFATQGSSTGSQWPPYTYLEKKYWLPIKRWALHTGRIEPRHILRWSRSPSRTAGSGERLYPSFAMVNHAEYVWEVSGNTVRMGSAVPYAANHNSGTGAYERRTSRNQKGRIVVPTPKRPLVNFGSPFIADLRYALGVQAAAMGGKVGITDAELARRFKLNGGKIGLR
jgi:hypothetical protein